jgi:hypothetical protein
MLLNFSVRMGTGVSNMVNLLTKGSLLLACTFLGQRNTITLFLFIDTSETNPPLSVLALVTLGDVTQNWFYLFLVPKVSRCLIYLCPIPALDLVTLGHATQLG